jgi:uncharacterized membrane protein
MSLYFLRMYMLYFHVTEEQAFEAVTWYFKQLSQHGVSNSHEFVTVDDLAPNHLGELICKIAEENGITNLGKLHTFQFENSVSRHGYVHWPDEEWQLIGKGLVSPFAFEFHQPLKQDEKPKPCFDGDGLSNFKFQHTCDGQEIEVCLSHDALGYVEYSIDNHKTIINFEPSSAPRPNYLKTILPLVFLVMDRFASDFKLRGLDFSMSKKVKAAFTKRGNQGLLNLCHETIMGRSWLDTYAAQIAKASSTTPVVLKLNAITSEFQSSDEFSYVNIALVGAVAFALLSLSIGVITLAIIQQSLFITAATLIIVPASLFVASLVISPALHEYDQACTSKVSSVVGNYNPSLRNRFFAFLGFDPGLGPIPGLNLTP